MKEFWIAPMPRYDSQFGPIRSATETKINELQIHVIDFLEYEKLVDEIEAYREAIESYIYNFERDPIGNCDPCNNNLGNLSELKDILKCK